MLLLVVRQESHNTNNSTAMNVSIKKADITCISNTKDVARIQASLSRRWQGLNGIEKSLVWYKADHIITSLTTNVASHCNVHIVKSNA
jgi:hypothetical protein